MFRHAYIAERYESVLLPPQPRLALLARSQAPLFLARRVDPRRRTLAVAHVSALVLAHPAMTAEQCSLLCRREGLALAHLGWGRFALVQTSAREQTMLRIAAPPDFRRERRRFDRRPDPEAA